MEATGRSSTLVNVACFSTGRLFETTTALKPFCHNVELVSKYKPFAARLIIGAFTSYLVIKITHSFTALVNIPLLYTNRS